MKKTKCKICGVRETETRLCSPCCASYDRTFFKDQWSAIEWALGRLRRGELAEAKKRIKELENLLSQQGGVF